MPSPTNPHKTELRREKAAARKSDLSGVQSSIGTRKRDPDRDGKKWWGVRRAVVRWEEVEVGKEGKEGEEGKF